jgi:hypothetical protein
MRTTADEDNSTGTVKMKEAAIATFGSLTAHERNASITLMMMRSSRRKLEKKM